MRKSKTYRVLEHYNATSKDTALPFREIYQRQYSVFLQNDRLRQKYYEKYGNSNTSIDRAFRLYPEPTDSYSILSGNLYQEVVRRKDPKIARFKKDGVWHYYIISGDFK